MIEALSERVGDGGPGLAGGDVAEGRSETPDGAAQHAHKVRGQRAAEVLAVADGRSDEGTAHGVGVEGEVAQQHADREDEDRRIGRQHAGRRGREVVEVHRRRDEPVEERHQHARHDGQYDAFAVLGRRVAALAHAPRGDAVADNCDNDERNAQEEHDGIAFRRSDVVDDDAQHQRESHAQREGHRKPGQRYRGREQDVRGVEDHAAQHDAADASPFGLREVFEEGTALGPDASHREAQENGEEHHADHVVPVEKLVTPGLAGEFLGVSPRAPAEHRDEAEDDCQRVAVNNEHSI